MATRPSKSFMSKSAASRSNLVSISRAKTQLQYAFIMSSVTGLIIYTMPTLDVLALVRDRLLVVALSPMSSRRDLGAGSSPFRAAAEELTRRLDDISERCYTETSLCTGRHRQSFLWIMRSHSASKQCWDRRSLSTKHSIGKALSAMEQPELIVLIIKPG
jgi:hypothetical protein